MRYYTSEALAFKAAGDMVAALASEGKPNCGFRVLKENQCYKVLMVPERGDGRPFYIEATESPPTGWTSVEA